MSTPIKRILADTGRSKEQIRTVGKGKGEGPHLILRLLRGVITPEFYAILFVINDIVFDY